MHRVLSSGEKMDPLSTQQSVQFSTTFDVHDSVRSAQEPRRKAQQTPRIMQSLHIKSGDS